MFPIYLPELNPNILEIGFVKIRWYSLAYIVGIIFCSYFIKHRNKKENFLSSVAYENWIMWIVISIMIGGRLGYVIFYNLEYFLENPFEIFAFWHGGMSFHGGLLGVIIGMWMFCKKYQINFLMLMDTIAVATPVGIFFGRIANFINMELYGRVTGSDFGIVFPNSDGLPRHPSQLYEAFLEGFSLFVIMFCCYKFTSLKNKFGVLSGIFLTLYSLFRMFIENFREPDQQIGFIFNYLTAGQMLCIPMILAGILIIKINFKKS